MGGGVRWGLVRAWGSSGPSDFDAFAPTEATGIELIVDDIDNIDFVNWT
jgi:hypothetical protein